MATARSTSDLHLQPGGLPAAIGVTRIARLTGLDRTGIEVASAVRPRGHILQVSNGKGRDWFSAERGALHEHRLKQIARIGIIVDDDDAQPLEHAAHARSRRVTTRSVGWSSGGVHERHFTHMVCRDKHSRAGTGCRSDAAAMTSTREATLEQQAHRLTDLPQRESARQIDQLLPDVEGRKRHQVEG